MRLYETFVFLLMNTPEQRVTFKLTWVARQFPNQWDKHVSVWCHSVVHQISFVNEKDLARRHTRGDSCYLYCIPQMIAGTPNVILGTPMVPEFLQIDWKIIERWIASLLLCLLSRQHTCHLRCGSAKKILYCSHQLGCLLPSNKFFLLKRVESPAFSVGTIAWQSIFSHIQISHHW